MSLSGWMSENDLGKRREGLGYDNRNVENLSTELGKGWGSVQIMILKRTGFKEFSSLLRTFSHFTQCSHEPWAPIFPSTFQTSCIIDFSQKWDEYIPKSQRHPEFGKSLSLLGWWTWGAFLNPTWSQFHYIKKKLLQQNEMNRFLWRRNAIIHNKAANRVTSK